MIEREDGLGRIQQQLSKDKQQQEQKDIQVEQVRLQLVDRAKVATARYQREVEATKPEAEEVMEQTIAPWFLELVESGTHEELLNWLRANGESIRLSGTIEYYWPEDALKALAKADRKLYQNSAEYVFEHYPNALEQGTQTHADSNEVWYAGIDLEGSRYPKLEGLRIWRQPVVGMGFGFAMISSSYDIEVNAHSVGSSFDAISPEFWIKFGEQITTGNVWNTIEYSMQPREIRFATAEETEQYRQDRNRRAEEYLRTREWH